jgi:hypothetical protein
MLMKTYVLSFAIATLAAGALAGAQTPPTATTPNSSQSSTTTTTTETPASNSSYSSSSTDAKAQMKECVAKQKQMNPSISEADAKKACKSE